MSANCRAIGRQLDLEAHVKNFLYCLCFLTFLMLASCTNASDASPTPLPAPQDTAEPTTVATATISSPDPEPKETESYPPPVENDGYPAPPDQAGYPAPPALPPAPDPYPGGVVWIIRPVGEQCDDTRSFVDLAAAVASLEDAGIPVKEADMVELLVCQACNCPTSEHYRLQIDPADLGQALRLGWQRE
jgi:hypothetical protein